MHAKRRIKISNKNTCNSYPRSLFHSFNSLEKKIVKRCAHNEFRYFYGRMQQRLISCESPATELRYERIGKRIQMSEREIEEEIIKIQLNFSYLRKSHKKDVHGHTWLLLCFHGLFVLSNIFPEEECSFSYYYQFFTGSNWKCKWWRWVLVLKLCKRIKRRPRDKNYSR